MICIIVTLEGRYMYEQFLQVEFLAYNSKNKLVNIHLIFMVLS